MDISQKNYFFSLFIDPAIKHATSSAFILSGDFFALHPIGDIIGNLYEILKTSVSFDLFIFDIFPTSPRDLFF